MQVLIFGAGFSGKAIGRRFADEGVPVSGTTRRIANFDALRASGIAPLQFDGTVSDELVEALKTVTHLVVSAGPDDKGDPVLRALGGRLGVIAPQLQWIGYLSTIGVYGNRDGGWVDEDGSLDATSQRGRWRIVAERDWVDQGRALAVPVALLRLAGIYGPGRNVLLNVAEGKAKRVIKPGQVFNRVHVDDIAGATALLAKGRLAGVFNGADDEPAPPQDVVTFAAGLLGVPPPPEISFEAADMSPMARSFYADNKRVSNGRLKEAGYRFRYPTYREALQTMHADDTWRGIDYHKKVAGTGLRTR